MSTLERLSKKWEAEYVAEKEKEVQELYNALTDVIIEKKAYRAHVIEALSLLLLEVLDVKHKQIEAERKLSGKAPASITK